MRRPWIAFLFAPLAVAAACSSSNGDADPVIPGEAGPMPTEAGTGDEAPAPMPEGGDETPPARPALAVLTVNLHCTKLDGTSFTTNEDRAQAIAAYITKRNVDVVLAQEVCKNAATDMQALLEAALAKATGARWSSTSAFAHRAWQGTPDEADENVAIFARGSVGSPRPTAHRANGALARVMLGATVTSAIGRARVYTVHLDHADAAARALQAREIASLATTETDDEKLGDDVLPIVVAGDFNAREATPPFVAMTQFGFVEASGSRGTTRIDHVFAHRTAPFEPFATEEAFTGAGAVSDHPGVLVRFGAGAAKTAKRTRIVAKAPLTSVLAVRGEKTPFDWLQGWPAFPMRTASGVGIVTTELPAGTFAYKFLRDDVDWQLGDNAIGQGQADNVSSPAFP